MNYKIEQATKDDLKSILFLNQDSIPAVSSSNLEMMKHFLIICDYFKVCKINGKIITKTPSNIRIDKNSIKSIIFESWILHFSTIMLFLIQNFDNSSFSEL